MGHKVNPTSFRLGNVLTWKSRWFRRGEEYRLALEEDYIIRKFILTKLKSAYVSSVEIERTANLINVYIITSRPGMIIGRAGGGIEKIQSELVKLVNANKELKITIKEIKNPETSAAIVAQTIAEGLEKRMPFRRLMKQSVERSSANPEVKGIRVMVAGRLNGADIARTEHLSSGRLPLHTLRANIDFARFSALTTYGIIGVKVWIYKGEIFNKFNENQAS